MTYINWLFEKLFEEVNYEGPDVAEILMALYSCASTPFVRYRISAIINLILSGYRSRYMSEYIRFAIILESTCVESPERSRQIQQIEYRLFCDLFIQFVAKRM